MEVESRVVHRILTTRNTEDRKYLQTYDEPANIYEPHCSGTVKHLRSSSPRGRSEQDEVTAAGDLRRF